MCGGSVAIKVVLFGGAGFVGRSLAARLTASGAEVSVYTRYPPAHRDLLVLPGLRLLPLEIERSLLRRQIAGADGVVNLVGMDYERRPGDFARAHVDFPRELADLCISTKISKVIHLSTVGAGPDAGSHYLRSKWQGESALAAGCPAAVILRPGLVFGGQDPRTVQLVRQLRGWPRTLLLPAAAAPLAPLYLGDLVRVILEVLADRKGPGRYDLCGPTVYRLDEWVQQIAQIVGRPVRLLPLGPGLSRWQSRLTPWVPGALCTIDQYRTLTGVACTGPWPERLLSRPVEPASVLANGLV